MYIFILTEGNIIPTKIFRICFQRFKFSFLLSRIMVFWMLSVIILIPLYSCAGSKYYYKEKNGNYDVYYGSNAQWGYKEFKPPKSYKMNYEDRGDRPGKCIRGEFKCDSPYPVSKTKFFECDVDYQCPRFFKCCQNRCFLHKICQPIDLEASDDNEIPTEGSVIKTTLKTASSKASNPTTQSNNMENSSQVSTSSSTSTTVDDTKNPTTIVKDEAIKQSTTISIRSTTHPKETHTTTKVTIEDFPSSSTTVAYATTNTKEIQPSTSYSTTLPTTERSEITTVTHLPTETSITSHSTFNDGARTSEDISTQHILISTTAINNEDTQSTSVSSTESSTKLDQITHSEVVATVTADHHSSSTFSRITTSKIAETSPSQDATVTTTKSRETTILPSSTPITLSTPKQLSTQHISKSTATVDNADMQTTSVTSTESSITNTKERISSTTVSTSEDHRSKSTPSHTTTPEGMRPPISHITSETSELTSVTHSPADVSTTSAVTQKHEETLTQRETSTTQSKSTPAISTLSSTTVSTSEDHRSKSTPPHTTTSEGMRPPISHSTSETSELTSVTHSPADVSTTSAVTRKHEETLTQRETSTTQSKSTPAISTQSSKTNTKEDISSTATTTLEDHYSMPTTLTSEVVRPSTMYSTTSKSSESTTVTPIPLDVSTTSITQKQEDKSTQKHTFSAPPTTMDPKVEVSNMSSIERDLTSSAGRKSITSSTTVYTSKSNGLTTSQIPETTTTTTTSKTSESLILTTQFPKSSTKNFYPTISEAGSTVDNTRTSISSNNDKDATVTTINPSYSTISRIQVTGPTTEPTHKTTKPVTDDVLKYTRPSPSSIMHSSNSETSPADISPSSFSVSSSTSRTMTESDTTRSTTTELTTQTTLSYATSPKSTTTEKYIENTSISSTSQKPTTATPTLNDVTTKSTTNFATKMTATSVYSKATQVSELLTTKSPLDDTQKTILPSSSNTVGKPTTRVIDITSDDEDLIFSGDFEPSTINNKPQSTVKDTKTTLLVSSIDTSKLTRTSTETSPTSLITISKDVPAIKSSTISSFTIITSPVSNTVASNTLLTSTYESQQKTGTTLTTTNTPPRDTTIKSVTDIKLEPITDDEDLAFSGEGDLESSGDNLNSEILSTVTPTNVIETDRIDDDFTFSNDSQIKEDVPESLLKLIPEHAELNNKESDGLSGSSTSTVVNDVTYQSTLSTIATKDSTGTVSEALTTLRTLIPNTESTQTITENTSSASSKELQSIGDTYKPKTMTTDRGIEGTQNTGQYLRSSIITSTPTHTSTENELEKISTVTQNDDGSDIKSTSSKNTIKENQISTSKDIGAENDDIVTIINTLLPLRSTPTADNVKNEEITEDEASTSSVFQYMNKIYMVDRVLSTFKKLPSVHEKAGDNGDNYNFNNFLGLLDKISDLLGKVNDTISNDLDYQTTTISSKRSSGVNTDQEKLQSTSEIKYLTQVVEVEN